MNKFVLAIFFITAGASCATTTEWSSNKWPRGMTPFFAECAGEGGTYTDNAYAVRKKQPCRGGWKFFDRGEPVLEN
jgi:hypothetical protein|tara:strand:- start:3366 stop:3593 length:228 start_codon:yes stop_codon:yes gene_type:complete